MTPNKWRSPAEAAALLRPRDSLGIPLATGQPTALLHALGERRDFERLQVFAALLTELFPLFAQPGVRLLSGFHGPVERGLAAAGHDVHFVPSDFRRFTHILRRLAPRAMATLVAPPDREGFMSLSLHAGACVPELHACGADPERLLIAEVNPAAPRTLGLPPAHRHALHVDEVDVMIESERPLFTLPNSEPSPIERAIAAHALRYIPSGATLQTGIGGVPNEIAELLAKGSGGDYGIHSEMLTDGLMQLDLAGKISNRKGQHDGYSVVTFAAGSRELYDWLHENPSVRFLPIEEVNTPSIISRNRQMVSINGALSVDLLGQIAADMLPGRQFSGIGGHEDFCAGAALAPGGHSLVCLPSTAGGPEGALSRIVPALPAGLAVTTPRHEVDVVITEHGSAELAGRTVEERAAALIGIADPSFRDALRGEWERAQSAPAGAEA